MTKKATKPPVVRIICGTLKGYNKHRSMGEHRCAACSKAHADERRARRRSGRKGG